MTTLDFPNVFAVRVDCEALRAARKARGWSQEEAGKQIGSHRSTIKQIELGLCLPNIKTLAVLCYVYGMSIDTVVEVEELPF